MVEGSANMGNDKALTVSAVVCCWTSQRERDIREAVTSLRNQTLRPSEVIVVVDNNRCLHSRLTAEMRGIARVVLHGGPRGVSSARTTGASVARSDLVAFLDDDAVAAPDWLEQLVLLFGDTCVIAAGGFTELDWGSGGRPWWFPPELEWTVGGSLVPDSEGVEQVRNPQGGNMIVRRELFCSLGGFSPDYGAVGITPGRGEEAEFCLRVSALVNGARVLLNPRARIRHKVRRENLSLLSILRRWWNEGYHKANLCWEVKQGIPGCSTRGLRGSSHERRASVLDVERSYLRRLLTRSVMSRILPVRFKALCELVTIVACIATVGMGYLAGMTAHLKPGRSLASRR